MEYFQPISWQFPFLYPLISISEIFWRFQGLWKWNIGMKWINNFPNKYTDKTLIRVIIKKWRYTSSMTLSTLWYYDFDLSNKYIYTEFSEKKIFLTPWCLCLLVLLSPMFILSIQFCPCLKKIRGEKSPYSGIAQLFSACTKILRIYSPLLSRKNLL